METDYIPSSCDRIFTFGSGSLTLESALPSINAAVCLLADAPSVAREESAFSSRHKDANRLASFGPGMQGVFIFGQATGAIKCPQRNSPPKNVPLNAMPPESEDAWPPTPPQEKFLHGLTIPNVGEGTSKLVT